MSNKVWMMARFDNNDEKNLAAKAALEKGIQITMIGEGHVTLGKNVDKIQTPFILFFGDAADSFFFMQKKARFTGPLC